MANTTFPDAISSPSSTSSSYRLWRQQLEISTIPDTPNPTQTPTTSPTKTPTRSPTKTPTKSPTTSPTKSPTTSPTKSPTAAPTAPASMLRRRPLWENRAATGLELTPLAREIEQQQSNCSLPIGVHGVDIWNGLGSHLHQWGQSVCNAIESGHRIRSYNPEWVWLDREHCPTQTEGDRGKKGLLECYFPNSEPTCPIDNTSEVVIERVPGTFEQDFVWCKRVRSSHSFRTKWRAAAMEYLFRQVSPVVLDEAERQARLLFPHGTIPENLIAMHVRWGDKAIEMDLAPIQEYITAVNNLLDGDNFNSTTKEDVHIYLATEDPAAVEAFKAAAPDTWNIYVDRTVTELSEFRAKDGNHAVQGAKATRGRGGLVALGSLLVALEANNFVLTTESNWSRVINELRKNVLDRFCNGCTRMVDLRAGEW